MDNRALLINMHAMDQLTLPSDDEDPDDADWTLGWEGYHPLPAVVYEALDEHGVDDDSLEASDEASPIFKELIREVIAKRSLDEASIDRLVRSVMVTHVDGASRALACDPQSMREAFDLVEAMDDEDDCFAQSSFRLRSRHGRALIELVKTNAALIDMPLHQLREAFDRLDDAHEAPPNRPPPRQAAGARAQNFASGFAPRRQAGQSHGHRLATNPAR